MTKRIPLPYGLSLIAAVVLAGCGGGGSSDGGSSPPLPNVALGGIWFGNTSSNLTSGTQEFIGVSTDNGRFRFLSLDTSGQFIGNLSATGTSVSGNGIGIAEIGSTWLNGEVVTNINLSGNMVEGSSFNGSWSGSTGESGNFNFSYDPIYERNGSLGTLAGSWISFDDFGNPDGSVTIDSGGRLDAQDAAGCLYTGNVSVVDPNFNAYNLSVSVTNCGEFNGSYSGLGVLADSQTTNDTFIYSMDNGNFFIIAPIFR